MIRVVPSAAANVKPFPVIPLPGRAASLDIRCPIIRKTMSMFA